MRPSCILSVTTCKIVNRKMAVDTAVQCHKNRFSVDENGWSVVTEGKAEILFPSEKDVFYNPVQEFNRDLTIAVINQAAKPVLESRGVVPVLGEVHENGLTVLEALAASGLRSVRFAREIPGLKNVIANDWSQQAVESIQRNVEHNHVDKIVTPRNGDASMAMYEHKKVSERFDVIDLDPYGSPTPFLDSALQSVADGGLLCVTATDMAVLCGNTPETCYSKYGAISLKSKSCHEMAIRIVLQCLEAHATRYGRYIKPLLSLSIDFYCRVFVRVYTGQAKCKESTSKLGHVFQCTGCEMIAFQRLGKIVPHENGKNFKFSLPTGPPVGGQCEHCESSFHIGGPIWLDPLHDPLFVAQLLQSIQSDVYATEKRMKGMLSVVMEELEDVPLYYEIPRLTNIVKQSQEKLTFYTSAILNSGFRFSLSHANRHGLKTDAPISFLWDVFRSISRRNNLDPLKNLHPTSPGYKIMSKAPITTDISFEPHHRANPPSREDHLTRFQINPESNWGPKARSKTSIIPEKSAKQTRNQGKHKNSGSKEGEAKKPKCDIETTPMGET
jgi:tRNA (guanine26-N2/guanine27-N2)-dimethyltransferase